MRNISEINQKRKKIYREAARVFAELKKYEGGLVDAFGMPAGHIPGSFFEDDADKKASLENKVRSISGYLSSLTWVLNIPDDEYEREFKDFGESIEKNQARRPYQQLEGKSQRSELEVGKQLENIVKMYKNNLTDLAKEISNLSDDDKVNFTSGHSEFFRSQLFAEYYCKLSSLLLVF